MTAVLTRGRRIPNESGSNHRFRSTGRRWPHIIYHILHSFNDFQTQDIPVPHPHESMPDSPFVDQPSTSEKVTMPRSWYHRPESLPQVLSLRSWLGWRNSDPVTRNDNSRHVLSRNRYGDEKHGMHERGQGVRESSIARCTEGRAGSDDPWKSTMLHGGRWGTGQSWTRFARKTGRSDCNLS